MTKNKYEITVEILLERKQQLLKELEGIDYTIASLNAMSPISNTTYKSEETKIKDVKLKKNILGYDSNNGVAAKFVFFLKKEQRFLHLREVAEMIIEADGSNEDVTEFARKMSSSLQSLKKKKYIIKHISIYTFFSFAPVLESLNCFYSVILEIISFRNFRLFSKTINYIKL